MLATECSIFDSFLSVFISEVRISHNQTVHTLVEGFISTRELLEEKCLKINSSTSLYIRSIVMA